MNQPRHPSFSVIKAPSALPRPTNSTPKTLFLSGRIPPPQQAQWQNELTNRLQHLPLTILNPLRLDWDSRWEAKTTFAPFNEQVNWELNGLKAADIVVAYFAPDSDCPVTLLEFGLTVAQRAEKVVCWCPGDYSKRGNVEIVCARKGVRVCETMDEVVVEVCGRVKGV
ncbi:hypothetical protein MBLNU457_6642t3 [Dothideomycetes sp. NU457]